MKTSAAVIAALFASVQAINIRQLAFMKAQEQLNGPAVGNEFPRFCEIGAPKPGSDVNVQGCEHFDPAPNVRSAPRAVASPPAGGDASLNYNKQTPNEAPASWPRPNTVRNLTDSSDGRVDIPFAYVQTQGVAEVPDQEPKATDPSKAATEDPIQLENEKLAEANKKQASKEGAEHEQEHVVEDPETKARVAKEEAQAKAQGAAVKDLLNPKEEPKEDAAANDGKWDQRASNDAARGEAAKAVASQVADEAAKVAENKKIVAEATEKAAADTNVSSRNKEGVTANSWHEQWVTKVVPQQFGDSYSADRQLRSGEPSKDEKDAAKANGPSEKEQKAEADAKKEAAPAAPAAAALVQLRTDPSKADAEEAAYQVVYAAE